MNISRNEQRVLHALAQGGRIAIEKDDSGHISSALCFTRDGFILVDCNMSVFRKLKTKRFIASRNSSPYTITKLGCLSVRSQVDNR